MASHRPSPINTRFLISLEAPDAIEKAVRCMLGESGSPVSIPAAMGIQLPLLESIRQPKPPVTGHLPGCENPLSPDSHLIRPKDSPWWIWPIDSHGWFEELATALSGTDSERLLYPLPYGIPMGVSAEEKSNSGRFDPETLAEAIPGWRAMNLVCTEIRFEDPKAWYTDLRWRKIWVRRLRRAPARTNNNK